MDENEVINIEVQMDVKDAEEGMTQIGGALDGLKEKAAETGKAIAKAFEPMTKNMGSLETGLYAVSGALLVATNSVNELNAALADQQGEDRAWSIVDAVGTGVSTLVTVLASYEDIAKTLKRVDLTGLSAKFYGVGITIKDAMTPAIDGIAEYIAAVKTAAPEAGTFAAMFPKLSTALAGVGTRMKGIGGALSSVGTAIGRAATSALSALKSGLNGLWSGIKSGASATAGALGSAFTSAGAAIGNTASSVASALKNGITTLKESAAAWVLQTKAKIADRAEDLKIIAMNTIEHVKAFSVMLGQLAVSTAAWVKNTAAKAASTAAEWAQIAATTAWQAICTAATAVTTAFGAAMSFLTSPIGLVVVAITAVIAIAVLLVKNWDTVKAVAISVWEKIKETFAVIGDWIYTNVVSPVSNFLSGLWSGIVSGATAAWEGIKSAFMAVGNWFYTNVVSPVADFLSGLWTGFKDGASAAWEGVKSVFSTVWNWFKDTLLDPLVNGFKGMVNGIIGFINGMIQGAVDGINSIIGLLNKLQFDIPDWVPGLGGQTFGFNIGLLNAPQIPYLAKGAVLPANKPFLAMVGDQRHGTNVEAPLATIQEAVALVMNDQVAAMMAGFEATVAEVRQLRQLVSGIEIGDKTIGQAARRYERKMAVVTGGRY